MVDNFPLLVDTRNALKGVTKPTHLPPVTRHDIHRVAHPRRLDHRHHGDPRRPGVLRDDVAARRSSGARGIDPALAQCNLAFNHKRGTLRGMHFQRAPHAQAKIVRCTRGALLDVIVDLRPGSPTFRQWDAVELTADNRRMLYMPERPRPRLPHADRRHRSRTTTPRRRGRRRPRPACAGTIRPSASPGRSSRW